nr:hypothetical protein [Brevundimonas naejangsanensis]
MTKPPDFATEADLVAAFVAQVEAWNGNPNRKTSKWTVYPETAGWDLLLVDEAGVQIGVEAKLSLNAKVICQALPDPTWADAEGPDYRVVLVPSRSCQLHMHPIARALGLTIIEISKSSGSYDPGRVRVVPSGLPDEHSGFDWDLRHWFSWLPARRCRLPEYVPDVAGGKPSPVALTEWKIKAIKLMILLDRRGFVTRRDMRLLGISPTRWTDAFHGFLSPDPIKGGYVRNGRTPDLRAQHPVNYVQIENDFQTWLPAGTLDLPANDTAPQEDAA